MTEQLGASLNSTEFSIVSLHRSCANLSKNESPKTGYKPHYRAFDPQQEEVLRVLDEMLISIMAFKLEM
jgi:hypothetical protein